METLPPIKAEGLLQAGAGQWSLPAARGFPRGWGRWGMGCTEPSAPGAQLQIHPNLVCRVLTKRLHVVRPYLPGLLWVCRSWWSARCFGAWEGGQPSAQRLTVFLRDTVLFSREALVVLRPDATR